MIRNAARRSFHRFPPALYVLCALALLAMAGRTAAHPVSLSNVRVILGHEGTHAAFTGHLHDLAPLLPAGVGSGGGASVADELKRQAPQWLQLRADGTPLVARSATAVSAGNDYFTLSIEYPVLPPTTRVLAIESLVLKRLPVGHQQLLYVQDSRAVPAGSFDWVVLAEVTLDARQTTWEVHLGQGPPTVAARSATESSTTAPAGPGKTGVRKWFFFRPGVEHILTGYDHLLFLAALLLVCDRFTTAGKIITLFTLAHSITLALAALNVVRLPSRVVESAIAASIVYVALENIFSGGMPSRLKGRWLITLAFGLIHGLGFASGLRDVGLGAAGQGVLRPLLQFNLGVEAGQLCVAACLLPIILLLRRKPAFRLRWTPILSAGIALIGACWLMHRLVGD